MHSVGHLNFGKCVMALTWLVDPDPSEPTFVYRKDHPRPKDFIARMQKGILDQSFTSFFTHYVEKIPYLTTSYIGQCMHLIWALINGASWTVSSDRDFLHDLFSHDATFSVPFRTLLTPVDELENLKLAPDQLTVPILMLMKRCTGCLTRVERKEGENLMRTWLSVDLFGALEAALIQQGGLVKGIYSECFPYPFWISEPLSSLKYHISFFLRLGWIAAILGDIFTIVGNTPSLLCIIRRHFPRPRLLRACLDMAFLHKDATSREPNVVILGSRLTILRTWVIIDYLESVSSIDRQCSRRGCRNRRAGRCSACKNVKYCGIECQSRCVPLRLCLLSENIHTDNELILHMPVGCAVSDRDWPEHRLCCGFQGFRAREPHKHPYIDTETPPLPQRLPFRLEKILPLSSLVASEPPDVHD